MQLQFSGTDALTHRQKQQHVFSVPRCFFISLLQVHLTSNVHVHTEGENWAAALSPRVNRADVDTFVRVLDHWQFGLCFPAWYLLTLYGNAMRWWPGDVVDGNVWSDPGIHSQGAVHRNDWRGEDGDWRGGRTQEISGGRNWEELNVLLPLKPRKAHINWRN